MAGEPLSVYVRRTGLSESGREYIADQIKELETELAEKKAEFTRMESAWRERVSRLERGYSGMSRQKTGYGEEPHEAD